MQFIINNCITLYFTKADWDMLALAGHRNNQVKSTLAWAQRSIFNIQIEIKYTYAYAECVSSRSSSRVHGRCCVRTYSKRIRQLLSNRKLANEVCNYIHIQFISNLITHTHTRALMRNRKCIIDSNVVTFIRVNVLYIYMFVVSV